MAAHLKNALDLLDRFERKEIQKEAEAANFLAEIFRACGHVTKEQGFIGGNRRADCFIDTEIAGKPQRIIAEINWSPEPAGVTSVQQAMAMLADSPTSISRSMVIARAGFSPAAIELAESEVPGKVDLLSPSDLRNWLSKVQSSDQGEPDEPRSSVIVRAMMAELADAVAKDPEELWRLEWRDLERVLGVAFNGLGFDMTVTRAGKDGGYDLELCSRLCSHPETYLVEVKHWSHQKPGAKHLSKLIKVTAQKKATAALLISTSGFAGTIYSGLTELTPPVRLGDGGKIVSLCKAYYRLKTGLWLDASDAKATLFSGTAALGEYL